MDQVEIRPIEQRDFEGFRDCLDAVARERKYLALVNAPSLESTRRWLTKAIERGEVRLVAVDNGEIIGWCDIGLSEREGFRHAGRLGMGVLKEYRGQGLGEALARRALEDAKSKGLERVELDVFASNTPAIALYEQLGFRLEGRKRKARKLDGQYDDMIMMALLFDE